MAQAVHQLLVTEIALDKLGRRGISRAEAEQLPRNAHVVARNQRKGDASGERALLIGSTDGGRMVTLVIERTMEPTTWLIVTGWDSSQVERKILES